MRSYASLNKECSRPVHSGSWANTLKISAHVKYKKNMKYILTDRLDSVLMRSRWKRWHKRGKHAVARRELDERLTALRKSLVIAAESTPAHYPGETALNHPTPGLRL